LIRPSVIELAELFGGPEQDALRVVVRHAHAAESRADDHIDHTVLVGDDMYTFVPQIDILASLHEKGTKRMFMN